MAPYWRGLRADKAVGSSDSVFFQLHASRRADDDLEEGIQSITAN